MQQSDRPRRGTWVRLSIVTGLVLVLCLPTPLSAQQTDDKESAREARISEYLRKKEARRAERELEKAQKAAGQTSKSLAEASPTEDADVEVVLPKELAAVQQRVSETPLGQDPTVKQYLELIGRGEATAQQLAAFGNFLAQNLMLDEALEYYAVALWLEDRDPLLWMNVGTLHRQRGELSDAVSAYTKSLSIDPNNGFAHYNLGATFDQMGKYENAIDEYKTALTLDPDLGEAETNPAAVNNERLLAVKILLYEEQGGKAGLSLADIPGGELEAAEDR